MKLLRRAKADLVQVDEIFIGGTAHESISMTWEFFQNKHCILNMAINAFGGIIRWVATPDQMIVMRARDFTWRVTATKRGGVRQENPMSFIKGHILYVDQKGVRHTHILPGNRGRKLELVSYGWSIAKIF